MLDAKTQFPELLKRTISIVKGAFPIESPSYVFDARNLRWDNVGPDVENDIQGHKQIKLKEQTLNAKLLADVSITDKNGKLISSRNGAVILTVPHITARGSYLVRGKEVQTINQLRLRPGLYTRTMVDNNIETFVNTSAAGTYRVILNREKGSFLFRVGTSSHFNLIAVLKALGISEGAMREAWGNSIWSATSERLDYPAQLRKLFTKLRPHINYPPSDEEAEQVIREFLQSKPMDPKVNQITVGGAFGSVSGEALLEASKKCLALSRGATRPDDTESLAFKSIHSVEDFIPEKLEQTLPVLRRMVASKMERDPKVEVALHAGLFTEPVTQFFTTSEFARHTDQTNPIEMASTNLLTTTMGEGGISSTHAVTEGVRLVHPSHIGVLDPLHTPEGQKIGITGRLSLGAKKIGTELYIDVINAKTGQRETKSLKDIDTKVIAFPDEYDLTVKPPRPKTNRIKGRQQTELREFSPQEVHYILIDPKAAFSVVSNMVPFLHNNDGNRVGMADRHIEQTIPLKNPDEPLVQAEFGGKGFEQQVGSAYLARSPVTGVVQSVSKQRIVIKGPTKTHEVQIHDNYPLNSNVYLDDKPLVKKGDRVTKGQILVENNFTKNKTLAMGKNLSVAYMPFKGMNFEDGIVISESAAEKLTSIHKYEERLDVDKTVKVGMKILLAHFPDQVSKIEDRDKYDSDGIIKKGSEVNHGDLLIPAVREQQLHEDYDYTKLHRALSNQWVDNSIYWDHDHKGKIIDVVRSAKFVKVIIATEEAATIGDKMSHRHGGKGIITAIIPDNEMYQNGKGEPIDVLFNPTGVPGRVNPGQLFESAAGILAEKQKTPYLVRNFGSDGSTLEKLQKELQAAGLDPNGEGTVVDPASGRRFEGVLLGKTHFLKLKHMVSKKFSARSVGEQYTLNEAPAKTEEGSAQRIGGMELYAMLSGDATQFVKDAYEIKANRNDEYWRAFQLGLPVPKPKTPFVTEKFNTYLMGAGINLKVHGTKIKALPLTDREIEKMSNGPIKEPTVVTASDLKPEKEGLFDPKTTGGVGGVHWTHIDLPEPILNPMMTPAATSVLGLTTTQMKGLLNGNLGVENGEVKPNADGDLITGGEALRDLLSRVDVARELKFVKAQIPTMKKRPQQLDKLNKKRRYLEALQKLELSPEEAYLNTKVPVVPPRFRAIYPLPDGALNISDVNHGYREVLMVANTMRDLKQMGISDRHLKPLREDMYNAVSGLVGLTEPITREGHYKGFITQIRGANTPKSGFFQGNVMKRPQDLSARSTVIPDPKLGLDEVGIPKEMGLKIYKPFLVKRLTNLGYKPLEAREMVEKGDEMALKALQAEAEDRPVVMNRAPSLHKFNVLAFRPRIVGGQAIQVNPLIVGGYNMDFDGDSVGIHVPVTEGARKELLEKMLPSKNMFRPSDSGVMHTPSMETVLGLWLMTKPEGTPKPAANLIDIVKLYHGGKAKVNDAFKVGGEIWCPGQVIMDQALPEDIRLGNQPMTKKLMYQVIEQVAKKYPKRAEKIITQLKDFGNHYVTEVGFSVSLRDLKSDTAFRDKVLSKALRDSKRIGFDKAHTEALKKIKDHVHKDTDNRFVRMSTYSGALGSKAGQVVRLVSTPVAVTDHKGDTVPVQIPTSYAEGHDMGSYWATLPGARKGMMDKGLSTADTGYLTKLLVNSNIDITISEPDCRTIEGVWMYADDPDIIGRVVAQGVHRNKVMTGDFLRRIKDGARMQYLMRSPLKCRSQRGICQKCFGYNEQGQYYPIGFHVGILAAQTIGEPSTQLALNTFHHGGSLGGRSAKGFPRVNEIFTLPENLRNKSVLAKTDGVVKAVTRASAGGWNVNVDSIDHYIPQELGLSSKVRIGAKIKAGQQLSERGTLKPQELLNTTGSVDRVRDAMIEELDSNFRDSGVKIKRRIYETTIKSMTDRARVTDPGDAISKGVTVGDVMSVNKIEGLNRGMKRKIEYEPILMGVVKVPHHGRDFVGRLMHQRLKDTLRDAPSLGLEADFGPNGHPITQLAYTGAGAASVPRPRR